MTCLSPLVPCNHVISKLEINKQTANENYIRAADKIPFCIQQNQLVIQRFIVSKYLTQKIHEDKGLTEV